MINKFIRPFQRVQCYLQTHNQNNFLTNNRNYTNRHTHIQSKTKTTSYPQESSANCLSSIISNRFPSSTKQYIYRDSTPIEFILGSSSYHSYSAIKKSEQPSTQKCTARIQDYSVDGSSLNWENERFRGSANTRNTIPKKVVGNFTFPRAHRTLVTSTCPTCLRKFNINKEDGKHVSLSSRTISTLRRRRLGMRKFKKKKKRKELINKSKIPFAKITAPLTDSQLTFKEAKNKKK